MFRESAQAGYRCSAMALGHFLSEARDYQDSLREQERACARASELFARSAEINTEKYTQIVATLNETGEVVDNLCSVLARPQQLPPMLAPNRYLPLALFYYIVDELRGLPLLLSQLCASSGTSLDQRESLRRRIGSRLALMQDDLAEGLRRLDELTDQALLEKKRVARNGSGQAC